MTHSVVVSLSCGMILFTGIIRPLQGQAQDDLPARSEMSTEKQAGAVKKPADLSQRLASRVTLRAKDRTVHSLIEAVARQANMRVSYYEGADALQRKVSVDLDNTTVLEAFNTIVKGSGLEVRPLSDGLTIVVRPIKKQVEKSGSLQVVGAISGRVMDSVAKKGLAGATISLNQNKNVAVSNGDGSFLILDVPYGEHIVTARKFGYRSSTQRVSVKSERSVEVELVLGPAATELNEVVTTVTGQQRKMEIGNDITTINVEEVMKQAPITSVTDLLEARVPGLTVMRTSGVPGAPSRIRLRGIGGGLLSGVSGAPTNDPIVIVDGIRIYAGQSGVDDQKLGGGKYPTPSPIDQIDPNSIEKIEVLRGPSAAAMYGADAGDGVIVITTKKGRAGSTRWDLSASRGIESMSGSYAAPGYYRFGHDPRGSQGGATQGQLLCPAISAADAYLRCALDSLVRFQALDESRLSTIDRGNSTRLSGTASGGSKDLTYSVTGSVANSLGLTKMPPIYQDLFRRLYDSAPTERMRRPNSLGSKSGQLSLSGEFRHGLNATYTTSLSQSIQNQSSANDQLSQLSSVYIDTNNINPGRPGQYAYQLNTKSNSALHALALNLLKLEWLPLTATVGMDRMERAAEGLTPRGIMTVREELWSAGYLTTLSEMSKGKFTQRSENINTTTGRINGTLFPRSRISLSLGSEVTQRSNSAIEGESDTLTEGVSRPSTLVMANRSGRTTTTGGWFVEPRLNMNSRFFVNPGFRFDGGGVSGSRGGFRGGLLSLFPKLNFSWIAVDREGREPLWGVVSLVRPRLAFGVAGVQPAAEWSLRTFEQHTGADGWNPILDSIAPDWGLRLRSVGNTRLGPEKTQEVEGGFDIQLWDTRLSLAVTGYYKVRKDAIERLPLAPSVGAMEQRFRTPMSYYSNIGHVRNTGAELSLNALLLDLPNVGWNIDVSISKYTNKLTKLFGEERSIDLGNGTRLAEGYPLFSRWSRPISGWTSPANGAKLWYGDYVVADSPIYMGMQAPDFEMPFRTSLTLLRGLLQVNGQFHFKAGLTQNNLGGGALLSNIYNNPNATYAEQANSLAASCYIKEVTGMSRRVCTDYGFIQKVNSLRFNSMSVGYNVPRSYLKRFPMSSLSLAVQGSNLGLWTNYRGRDPDVNGNLIGDVTQDSGQLPMPRTWSLQIRVGT